MLTYAIFAPASVRKVLALCYCTTIPPAILVQIWSVQHAGARLPSGDALPSPHHFDHPWRRCSHLRGRGREAEEEVKTGAQHPTLAGR